MIDRQYQSWPIRLTFPISYLISSTYNHGVQYMLFVTLEFIAREGARENVSERVKEKGKEWKKEKLKTSKQKIETRNGRE